MINYWVITYLDLSQSFPLHSDLIIDMPKLLQLFLSLSFQTIFIFIVTIVWLRVLQKSGVFVCRCMHGIDSLRAWERTCVCDIVRVSLSSRCLCSCGRFCKRCKWLKFYVLLSLLCLVSLCLWIDHRCVGCARLWEHACLDIQELLHLFILLFFRTQTITLRFYNSLNLSLLMSEEKRIYVPP